jgi:hypothetical protein
MDYPIYTECSECVGFGTEDHKELVNHILTEHSGYTPLEAEEAAINWEEDAAEREEARNIYKSDYYKRYGVDPDRIDQDPL